MTPKRKKVQDYVIGYMRKIEPEGTNAERYEKMFDEMSDKEFDDWMKDLKNGEEILSFYAPAIKTNIKMERLLAIAKELGIDLFARLKLWDEPTQSYYLTPHKYLVLTLPVRRMSQFVDHKLPVAESDSRIDILTGQVMKPDKASSHSQVEAQALFARGLDKVNLELIKFRGGDTTAFAEYKRELEETGKTSIGKDTGSIARSAVVLDQFLAGMHIESNASGV